MCKIFITGDANGAGTIPLLGTRHGDAVGEHVRCDALTREGRDEAGGRKVAHDGVPFVRVPIGDNDWIDDVLQCNGACALGPIGVGWCDICLVECEAHARWIQVTNETSHGAPLDRLMFL